MPFDTSEAFSKGGVDEGHVVACIEIDDGLTPVHSGSCIKNVTLRFRRPNETDGKITLAVELLRER
jgi:hypothetical protein